MLLKRKTLRPLLGASIATALVVGWTLPASTQDSAANFLGSWEGQGRGTVTATVRRHAARPGQFEAEILTASGACAGLIEVTGQMGDVSIASAEHPHDGGPVCKVEFRHVAPDRLNLVEMGDCSHAHGFRCGFTAELTRIGTEKPAKNQGNNQTASANEPGSAGGSASSGQLRGQGPSFDCSLAASPTEKAICSSDQLSALDRSLASAYSEALAKAEPEVRATIKADQRTWLVGRDRCLSDIQCLALTMRARASDLTATAGSAAAPQLAGDTTPRNRNRRLVSRAQDLLNQAGYDAGPVDGAFGRRTRQAILAFETDQGLGPTGVVSHALVARLVATVTKTAETSGQTAGNASRSPSGDEQQEANRLGGVYCINQRGMGVLALREDGDALDIGISSWQGGGHHCGLLARANPLQDGWVLTEAGCTVSINVKATEISIEAGPHDACRQFCGNRATLDGLAWPRASKTGQSPDPLLEPNSENLVNAGC